MVMYFFKQYSFDFKLLRRFFMFLSIGAIIVGFILLVWSADKFVDGASSTAKHLGMPSLLIGMVIVGFGTSAPEMVVSAIAASEGNPGLALGNAFGSNIVNIALILGVTAIIAPIVVHSDIIKKELPMLVGIILLSGLLLIDGSLELWEGFLLLGSFFALVGWQIYTAIQGKKDTLEDEVDKELESHLMPLKLGVFWLIIGIILLIASSKILVWGAVDIAKGLGVSDLIIGLTIIALGTSLPELAASVVAVKKGEYDIAIGNVVGSNMFNILAVIGIAITIEPMYNIPPEVLQRDWFVMMFLTLALFAMGYHYKGKQGTITRIGGIFFILCYIAYNTLLGLQATGTL